MNRCACRPGCLTWLRPADSVIQTPAGEVLVEHLTVQPYPEALGAQDAHDIVESVAS